MSDQRRIVESETPRWRAASEVVRPRRWVLGAFIGKVYGGLTPVHHPWCSLAQVFATEASVGCHDARHGPPLRARSHHEAVARGAGRAPRARRQAPGPAATRARRDAAVR